MPEEMKKLDASLQCEWELWRSRARADPATPARDIEIVARFTGDAALLEQAGLRLGYVSGRHAVGYTRVSALPALEELETVQALHIAPKLRPLLNESVPAIDVPPVWKAPLGYTGRDVIIGIIDDGIDIGHPAFRRPSDGHSRVLRLWDQQDTTDKSLDHVRAPRRFVLSGILDGKPIPLKRYGVEWTQEELTEFLQHNPAASVALPGIEPAAAEDRVAHGSHTAGIAAGNGKGKDGCTDSEDVYVGVAPEADLVIVKWRGGVSEFIHAVCYIVQFASTAANFPGPAPVPRPVVISCSLGFGDGETNVKLHDELMEPINALMAASASRAFVAGSGNSANRKLHAIVPLLGGNAAPVELKFLVPVQDVFGDQFDLSYVGSSDLVVTVRHGAGPSVTLTAPSPGEQSRVLDGHEIRYWKGNPRAIAGMDSGALSFSIDPPASQPIASDEWTLGLLEPAGRSTLVNAWIQEQFGDPNPVFTDTFVDQSDTVASPARARNVIAVGAYESRSGPAVVNPGNLSIYSGRGRVGASLEDLKPDVVAPGNLITASRSRARKSTKISECVRFYGVDIGTSMAAPHVAGVVALMFQRNRTLTFHEIRTILRNTAKKPTGALNPPVGDLPNERWGFGIVSAVAAVNSVPPSNDPAAGTHAGTMVAEDERRGPNDPVPPPTPPGPPLEPDPDEPPVLSPDLDPDAPPDSFLGRPLPWSPQIPGFAQRLRSLDPLLEGSRAARLVMALISTHVDEIARLINENRRVGAVWRGSGGPTLVRHVIMSSFIDWPIVPAEVAGVSMHTLLARLLKILQRYGGERLRSDARRYRELIVAVPGAPLSALDALVTTIPSA